MLFLAKILYKIVYLGYFLIILHYTILKLKELRHNTPIIPRLYLVPTFLYIGKCLYLVDN